MAPLRAISCKAVRFSLIISRCLFQRSSSIRAPLIFVCSIILRPGYCRRFSRHRFVIATITHERAPFGRPFQRLQGIGPTASRFPVPPRGPPVIPPSASVPSERSEVPASTAGFAPALSSAEIRVRRLLRRGSRGDYVDHSAVPGPLGCLQREAAPEISSGRSEQYPPKTVGEELGQAVWFYANQEAGAEFPSRQTKAPRSC